MTTVELFEDGDPQDLADLAAESWKEAFGHVVDPEVLDGATFSQYAEKEWAVEPDEFLEEPVVAIHKEGLVGWARFRDSEDETEAEVQHFFIHPEHWGTGAAEELHKGVIDFLWEEGYDSAHIWNPKDGPKGHRFLEKMGWQKTGKTRNNELFPGACVTEEEFRILLVEEPDLTN